MQSYSPYQFAFFRIILGIYLIIHFCMLIPYAAELWSNQGAIVDPHMNLTFGVIPNLLEWQDSPGFVKGFVIALVILSALFTLGIFRQAVSFLIWLGWLWLFNRNNFISNPSIPVVGWLLLICCVVPKGEAFSFSSDKDNKWELPSILFYGAWVIMAIGYTISGIDKLQSPSWVNGDAVLFLLDNPLARNWFLRDLFMSMPHVLIQIMTWSILAAEITFLPLCIWKKTRPYAWLAMIVMHLGILCIVDFADLTVGMLMIHIFTLDGRWFKPSHTENSVIFFDGYCGLCNNFVDFVIKEDTSLVYKFSPLQGEKAKNDLPSFAQKLDTVVLWKEGKAYYKSEAALRILSGMGNIWRLSKVLLLVPQVIRNAVYTLIAVNRYKWFGKKEACRIPSPEERSRFED